MIAALLSGGGVLPTAALSQVEPSPVAEMPGGAAKCDSTVALVTAAEDSSMLPEEQKKFEVVPCHALPSSELHPLRNDEPDEGSQQDALPDDEARALHGKSDEFFQPFALQDAEADEIHGWVMDSYTNIYNVLTSGCALCATYSGIVDVFVETIGGYAGDLTDELLDEQDPLASKVLTRRIDESAQFFSTIAALRGEVLKPHTNRIVKDKRRGR